VLADVAENIKCAQCKRTGTSHFTREDTPPETLHLFGRNVFSDAEESRHPVVIEGFRRNIFLVSECVCSLTND
jgi:hypothetical protein